jgi:peptide deformylase
VFVVRPGCGLPELIINPTWDPSGVNFVKEMESCLSIPEISLNLERLNDVHLIWNDMEGIANAGVFSGFAARVIQHEVDHLNGKLLTDRLNTKDRAKLRVQMFNSRKAGR